MVTVTYRPSRPSTLVRDYYLHEQDGTTYRFEAGVPKPVPAEVAAQLPAGKFADIGAPEPTPVELGAPEPTHDDVPEITTPKEEN